MKKRIVEYRGRKYRVVKAGRSECRRCSLWTTCNLKDWPPDFGGIYCGEMGAILRETLRSRLATWWRGWVKRNIIDDYPYPGEM